MTTFKEFMQERKDPKLSEWNSINKYPEFIKTVVKKILKKSFFEYPCLLNIKNENENFWNSLDMQIDLSGSFDVVDEKIKKWIEKNGIKTKIWDDTKTTEIIFALSKNKSYLLIKEIKENGFSENTNFMFCWNGGTKFYSKNDNEIEKLIKKFNEESNQDSLIENTDFSLIENLDFSSLEPEEHTPNF